MMKPNNWFTITFTLVVALFMTFQMADAQPVRSQSAGGELRRKVDYERTKRLEQRLDTQEKKVEGKIVEEIDVDQAAPTVLITQIKVEGATLISSTQINAITSRHENKKLTMREIQQIADEITSLYRDDGYVTSRAYVPPQSLRKGRLIIKVIEGKLGQLDIRGNQYFKSDLLRNYIDLEPQGYFDYSALQRSLVYINEHPDRVAKIVLVPGVVPGTTDLILDVDDQRPIHIGFEYDNFASRYLKEDRFALVLEHNNLFGFDDKLHLKGQLSEDALLELYQLRYVFPINKTLDVGFYFLSVNTELGKELKVLNAEGEAFLAGIYISKELIYRDNLEMRVFGGFDYKDIENSLLGVTTSDDDLRVFKIGMDLDFTDRYGRNIFTAEFDFGVPDFLGASDDKDPMASRLGAGGKFQKWLFYFFRLHPMPFESYILWKNAAQFSNHNLVASEQFQIGGPTSVRGYAPAEYSGDKGYYTALEWSFPLYFLSKEWKIPYREERWYDCLRWVIFYDFGFVDVKTPLAGEEETQTLKGFGTGLRVNVKDDLEMRVEVAWPDGPRSQDGDRAHVWVEFRLKF